MKKTLIFISLLVALLFLVGCKKKETTSKVMILSEEISTFKMTYHVHVPNSIKMSSEADLLEVALSTAHLIYHEKIDMIGSYRYEMILILYKNSSTFESKNTSEYGQIKLLINSSKEEPGIQLFSTDLTF